MLDRASPLRSCDGDGWSVPAEALLAVGYWVFFVSIGSYFLLTWGNQHVDASVAGLYNTVQPLAAVVASMAVIALTPPPHRGLEGPGVQDLGAIGIFVGLLMLIRDSQLQAQRAAGAGPWGGGACDARTRPAPSEGEHVSSRLIVDDAQLHQLRQPLSASS